MPHISHASQKRIILFAAAFLCGFLLNILSQLVGPLQYSASVLYSTLLIAWAVTIKRRVLQMRLRRCLIAAAMLLLALFVLRLCRWVFFAWSLAADRFLWLLYYIPYTAVPLLSLCAALCVGRGAEEPSRTVPILLWGVWSLLAAGFMTNDLHHWVFYVTYESGGSTSHYAWLYFVVTGWCTALTIAAFWTLMHRCRLSQCRRLWYVPVLSSSTTLPLLLHLKVSQAVCVEAVLLL